jgi:hypothetical protein
VGFILGMDVGKKRDFTTVAFVEEQPGDATLHLRQLLRFRLRTRYTEVAKTVSTLLNDVCRNYEHVPLAVPLVVDATGVGEPVVDQLVEKGVKPVAITITGAQRVGVSPEGQLSVPKEQLVGALQVALQNRNLRIAQGMPLLEEFFEEMRRFRAKQNKKTGHVRYEHERPEDHDDLVLAAALAVWYARFRLQGLEGVA